MLFRSTHGIFIPRSIYFHRKVGPPTLKPKEACTCDAHSNMVFLIRKVHFINLLYVVFYLHLKLNVVILDLAKKIPYWNNYLINCLITYLNDNFNKSLYMSCHCVLNVNFSDDVESNLDIISRRLGGETYYLVISLRKVPSRYFAKKSAISLFR